MAERLVQTDMFPSERRTADFSACKTFRYTLFVQWADELPLCQFIGLNPSTATEFIDDPTVFRIKTFCRDWGYGGLVMTNIFAFRSTDPKNLYTHPTPIGEPSQHAGFTNENDFWLTEVHRQCALTVAAWGIHGAHLERGNQVAARLPNLKCLGLTISGFPKHPLYLKKDTKLLDFPPAENPHI